MYKIKLLNKIAAVGTNEFTSDYVCSESAENADAIMVRSAVMHEMTLDPTVKAVARAGAGVNTIPVDRLAGEGVVVFNTPGANANGVKELAIAALIMASRNIVGAVEWAATLAGTDGVAKAVETGKSKFVGTEIEGKMLGVIGLGAVGGMVANAAKNLGMSVIGCDPFITIEAAWSLSRAIKKANTYDEIYSEADYITLHVPSNPQTRGMINAESIAKMKDGVKIINLSRADIVNAADIKAAIESGKVSCYVTDFPTEETVGVPGIIAIPHLGASTVESEDNCAVMAAHQLADFLENGNITNSVNYPNVNMPRSAATRLCIFHKNIPNMLSHISGTLSAENINIENMINKSRGDFAYTMVDTNSPVGESIISAIENVDGIIRAYTV